MNNQTKHCWELGILETLFTYHQIYWSHHGHFRWRRQVRRKDMKLPTATKGFCFAFVFVFFILTFPNMGRCFGKKIQVATKIYPFLTTLVWPLSLSHTHVCNFSDTVKDFALKRCIYIPWKKKLIFPWLFFWRRFFFPLVASGGQPSSWFKRSTPNYPEDISHQAPGIALNTFCLCGFCFESSKQTQPHSIKSHNQRQFSLRARQTQLSPNYWAVFDHPLPPGSPLLHCEKSGVFCNVTFHTCGT